MSRQFDAEPVLAGLTPFQRDTVEHIIDRFYGPRAAHRFLVADETGLGKTIVARGVIARTIEELERDDSVQRIDVVYVCSNTDLAHQNLRKLNVTGHDHHNFASRLTLLAKHSRHLMGQGESTFSKPVNLVSFTPGTSFEKGWRSGKAEERAMLYLLLEHEPELGLGERQRADAALQILQGSVSTPERFRDWYVEVLRSELAGEVDVTVANAFTVAARQKGLLSHFGELVESMAAGEPPSWEDCWRLVGELRSVLARASVDVLEPDLVILDEFQRFRHLLDPQSEAGELAHHLYDYGVNADGTGRPTAKTLLLSATPYKPFTYAEEGEDHHKDFMQVVGWLSARSNHDPAPRIATALAAYRVAVTAGEPVDDLVAQLRSELLNVMTRTERPRMLAETMTSETVQRVDAVSAKSLVGYVALQDLARLVDAPMSIEYWKSSAYFANFLDGYKIATKIRDALADPLRAEPVRAQLKKTHRLDFAKVAALAPLDPDMGNARLRRLSEQTIDKGWWKLLWLPPSLPYLKPGGPYADLLQTGRGNITKRLVFSSWTATPTAIASLLSYEADRLAAGESWQLKKTPEERDTERRGRRGRLAYKMSSRDPDRPATMAQLALFWPMPGLADLGDPRSFRRRTHRAVDADQLVDAVAPRLGRIQKVHSGGDETPHWVHAFAREDSLPSALGESDISTMVTALAGQTGEDTDDDVGSFEALRRHVVEALEARSARPARSLNASGRHDLAQLAAHSPANIAYRALRRMSSDQTGVTTRGLWIAAAHLASALQTMFRRPETTLLLDQLIPHTVYWRAVLQYCAWGNLQAVMDEYLHHLAASQGNPDLDDDGLLSIAQMAAEAIALRPVRYEVFDPEEPDERQTMSARFALRYGGRRQDQENTRQPQVRQAFNSPFWPFVLASTSVGQEGIDFHWWCHSLLHWNTPASPIDFEQREGRIDRYDGHAVRLNIAQHHANVILRAPEDDPWDAAYRIAAEKADTLLGAFAPHWVYTGDAKIERHVAPYALSSDVTRLARIKRDVALYRLTFGQPRQEDLLELLQRRYANASPEHLSGMRIDLSAPVSRQHDE